MRWITQLNVRLDRETDTKLTEEADIAGSTRAQIAREAIRKELAYRERMSKLELAADVSRV